MINDFSKFYTFMEIVKERSFSKASRALGISQPAVTLQMKKLEEALQTTLIMRKKNGIVLTREGEKFYKLCTQFESAMFRFKDELARINQDKRAKRTHKLPKRPPQRHRHHPGAVA